MKRTYPLLVILAGGASSRLWPLRDKSLIRFRDCSLFQHQVETYWEVGFRNFAVVCNPDNRQAIQAELRFLPKGSLFYFTTQKEPRGMGDALLTLAPLLKNTTEPLPVYICQVHDIFDPALHQAMLDAYNAEPTASHLASYRVSRYFPGGYLVVDENLRIREIVEKPGEGNEPSDLVNIVAHMHPDLGRLLEAIRREYARDIPTDDHYERAMARLMREYTFRAVPYTGSWYPIKYPWHVLEAMHYHLKLLWRRLAKDRYLPGIPLRAKTSIIEEGAVVDDNVQIAAEVRIHHGAVVRGPAYIAVGATIEDGVHISGPAYIGAGVRLFHGADVRGPVHIGAGTLVGQHAHVRGSMISQDCIIGAGSEVTRSYLGRKTMLHAAMLLDSVTADSDQVKYPTNIAARTVTANLRSDWGKVYSTIKGKRVATGLDKLGAIIGAGTFIGVNVMLMPGVKIGEGCVIGPSTVVMEDVPDHSRYYAEQTIIHHRNE